MTTNLYCAKGFKSPDGDAKIAKIETPKATISFDGVQGMGDADPNPA